MSLGKLVQIMFNFGEVTYYLVEESTEKKTKVLFFQTFLKHLNARLIQTEAIVAQ